MVAKATLAESMTARNKVVVVMWAVQVDLVLLLLKPMFFEKTVITN